MAGRRKTEEPVVEVVNDTGEDIDKPIEQVPVEQKGEPSLEDRFENLRQYTEALAQELRNVEQRVSDLEALISQPSGSVDFYGPLTLGDGPGEPVHVPPVGSEIPDYIPSDEITSDGDDGEVGWYRG